MIELNNNSLDFSFPELHPEARLKITFQRTLRIPDDDRDYPLPPGLGPFPLRHVDDFAGEVPKNWIEHGGVMLPMYQSEAMWINFTPHYLDGHESTYPFAVKVATGKINAVTGDQWSNSLKRDPQDYLVTTEQPWIDGYCVEKGIIRQFVAMPLRAGYTVEEQITGDGKYGGIQIAVYPMKREVFEKRFPEGICDVLIADQSIDRCEADMGLAAGGRMRQEIYEDPFELDDWELEIKSRCFIHIANSMVWRSITSENPPTVPLTAKEYTKAGLPWFDYYDENATPLNGSQNLGDLKSVKEIGKDKGDIPLPENESVNPEVIVKLRKGLKKKQVREGSF
jgi:hypothetical protein